MTPSGLERAAFRLVSQCLNPLAPPRAPLYVIIVRINQLL